MRWLELKVPPPVVGLLVGVAMWLSASLGASLPLTPGVRNGLAIALFVIAAAFDLGGLIAFRVSRTTINPLRPERASALVTSGVYRVTRNPMYVGMACLLLAWAIYLGAWLALLGPVVFVLYITRFQIAPEEQVMRRLFGEAYDRYAVRVRRWL